MIPVAHTSHASTIEVLPDGSLAAAWFSGEHEEASGLRRLAIVFSVLKGGEWSKPQTISERDGYANQNPVLFYDKLHKTLHLYHSQAKAQSGESKATIWHVESSDLGKRGQNRLYGIHNQVAFQGTESYRIRLMTA